MIATMPRPCTTVRFAERAQADHARRTLRKNRVVANVTHCDRCDSYHVSADRSQIPSSEIAILTMLAQGMYRQEISRATGQKPFYAERKIRAMMKKYYAVNNVNLVTIAIALGIVDPTPFVPALTEAIHA